MSFLTTIPTGRMSVEDAAKESYLFPVIGLFIGIIVGLISFILFQYLNPVLAAILSLFTLYLITGINHIDGLADFADGVYTLGDRERKVKAMKDTNTGVAGILTLFFILALYLFSFYQAAGNILFIAVAEISAKTSMLSVIFLGKSRGDGLGGVFIENMNRRVFPLSLLFSLVICFYLTHYLGLIAIVMGLFTSIAVTIIAHRNFGCVSGDILGAVNEISRVIVLVTLISLR